MLIDGKKIAESVLCHLKDKYTTNNAPTLAVMTIGDNPVIDSFVRIKNRVANTLGIKFEETKLPAGISQNEAILSMKRVQGHLCGGDGFVLQLPLPEHLNIEELIGQISIKYDIDVLHTKSYALWQDGKSEKVPPVPSAINAILKTYDITLSDKKILVIGRGRLAGKPVHDWLTKESVPHTIIDKETQNNEEEISKADIIISCAGVPNLITPNRIRKGVVLIDAGTSNADGTIHGDIDPDCESMASFMTPTPGGVGPVMVAELMRNLYR